MYLRTYLMDVMITALPIPVAALGGESHVLPFYLFCIYLYLLANQRAPFAFPMPKQLQTGEQ